MIVESGPDVTHPCVDPGNILSVNTTYVVGIGWFCSVYNEWTAYNDFSSDDLKLLANNCTMMESSAPIIPLPSVAVVLLLTLVTYFGIIVNLL